MNQSKEGGPLPNFQNFTFTLSKAETDRYRYYTPDAIKGIKYLESLGADALLEAFSGVEEHRERQTWGTAFDSLKSNLGDGGWNPRWLAARLADIVEDQALTDHDEEWFARIREEIG